MRPEQAEYTPAGGAALKADTVLDFWLRLQVQRDIRIAIQKEHTKVRANASKFPGSNDLAEPPHPISLVP
jgi:hypothetical protein